MRRCRYPCSERTATFASGAAPINRVVDVDGERGLYLRCSGNGSPTLVLEGGDGDTSDSYAFAERRLAEVTRTWFYDRANLGRSDPAVGPQGYTELVEDLERLLVKAEVREPYVLVGTSGGGYISRRLRLRPPRADRGDRADRGARPLPQPAATDRGGNEVEPPLQHRAARLPPGGKGRLGSPHTRGDIPVTIVSNAYSNTEIAVRSSRPSARGCEPTSKTNRAG